MLRKVWTLVALAALGSMVFANVDLRTNIRDIYYRGTCEEAGAITMSVNGNDFVNASTSTPVYIRIRLDKQASLCQTLVNRDGQPDDDPIYLAMRVETGISGVTIIAQPATVSIIRWIGGEDQLWLRVQTASDTWLDIEDTPAVTDPPNINARVAWTFGVSARASNDQFSPLYLQNLANAPFNSYVPGSTLNADAVSTLLCVDVSDSLLAAESDASVGSDQSALNFDTISWDYTTEDITTALRASDIRLGNQLGINFSGDDTIARGIDQSCELEFTKHGRVYADLCLYPGGQDEDDDCWVSLTNSLTLDLYCDYGWNYTSQFVVYTPGFETYGFEVWVDDDGDPYEFGNDWYRVAASALSLNITDPTTAGQFWAYQTHEDFMFVSHGVLLTSAIWAIYVEPDVANTVLEFNLTATVWTWCENDPTDVIINVGGFAANHGEEYDDAPWDEEWQIRRCPPSYYPLNTLEWNMGAFVPCESDRVVIFFPYLPLIAENDTFWAGISIVNQGLVSFSDNEVEAHIYEADGSQWNAYFPALATREQQTYLLADDEQGVGFYNDTLFIPVEAQGSDLVPLDNRSSMFVIGQHLGTSVVDTAGPDLDGFAMIGNNATGDVYGYLPRNFDEDVANQNADLPVLRSKSNKPAQVTVLPPAPLMR